MNTTVEGKKILKIKSLLYDCTNDDVRRIISKIEDQEVLYMYAYNYNWDNGFEIPQAIIDNDKCTLSTALLLFYRADGVSYLLEKSFNYNLAPWSEFIKKLYNSILNNKFQIGEIGFRVQLSKVQLCKLKKVLVKQENIFIESIEGVNLDIDL